MNEFILVLIKLRDDGALDPDQIHYLILSLGHDSVSLFFVFELQNVSSVEITLKSGIYSIREELGLSIRLGELYCPNMQKIFRGSFRNSIFSDLVDLCLTLENIDSSISQILSTQSISQTLNLFFFLNR
ncbi:hypothetical protein BpHYR1_017537 [Brachionus plicatilis]|uniref:Uncharacterized protein n=1 Tax=Brachionus plicatilis TaxID=10195 RepID=A0A3M7PCR0_BRAPC|nr:hypothetical protein BpHYR1_017537 [Brachionus plicatilis]